MQVNLKLQQALVLLCNFGSRSQFQGLQNTGQNLEYISPNCHAIHIWLDHHHQQPIETPLPLKADQACTFAHS